MHYGVETRQTKLQGNRFRDHRCSYNIIKFILKLII